jgi:hypothetical protein
MLKVYHGRAFAVRMLSLQQFIGTITLPSRLFSKAAAWESGKIAGGPGMGRSTQLKGRIRIQKSNLKSNRGKRGETWQPLMRR